MTRPPIIPIILAGFLSGMLLLQSAGIGAQGAERDGETTAVRAGEMTSTAPASSWIPQWFPKGPVLPPSMGAVIRVATVEELLTAVDRVQPGGTILLAEGHYRLPRVMVLRDKKNITLRSASGDPAKTILSGQGWDSQARGDDILHIARCEGVTVADLAFTDCRSYGIKVEAENAPKDIHIYNCRFRNIGVRAIKGSAGQDPNVRAVKGSVRYCTFENTRVPPADWLFGGDYIAAIDMMALEDWTFSDNLFRNIRGRNGGGRAAIFIWVRSQRVVVERNFILDCDRGVAFGNPGQSTANLAGERLVYVADGVIRNNFIAGGPDCGIELWYTDRIKVQHNSIWRPERNWRRGIRIGTGTANAQVVNNLVHGEILLEGGGADLRNNLTGRLDKYCVDPASGNLTLTPAATRAIDQAVPLPDVEEAVRVFPQPRPAPPPLPGEVPPPRLLFGDATRHGRPFAKDPSVLRLADRYLMYYSMAPSTNQALPKGWAIGIAESLDLVRWNKVGEILPEQACEQNGLVNGKALLLGGRVHLFYNSYGNGKNDALCHATSDDGLNFTRNPSNPILHPTGDWNSGRAIDCDAFEFGGKLWLIYATRNPSMQTQMLVAATADPQSDFAREAWTPVGDGPILKPELPWETRCIEAPSVIQRGDTLYLFYGGGYNNDPQQIGCAISTNGLHWTRLFHEPLIPNGQPGDWNSSETGHPGVFTDTDGRTYLFVQGNNDKGRTWFLSAYEITWQQGRPAVLWESDRFPMKRPGPAAHSEGRISEQDAPSHPSP
ncbi:MAG: family 43 glycosylhydrolase [Verrucomicrobiia bacterium]